MILYNNNIKNDFSQLIITHFRKNISKKAFNTSVFCDIFRLGENNMFTYIDIAILVIVALCVVVGYFRGFVGSIVKLFSGTVKFVISYFLCKPFATLVANITKLDDALFNKFYNWSAGLSGKFTTNLVGMSEEQISTQVSNALSDTKFPRFLRGIFQNIFNINPETINSYEEITISDLMAKTLSMFTLIICSFIFLYILITIVLFLIKHFNKKRLQGQTVLIRRDRRWGAVVGFVKSFVIVVIVFVVLSIFKNSELFSGFYETINKSFLGGPLSRWIFGSVEKYFDFKQMLVDWLM